jgi:hypothetical protein
MWPEVVAAAAPVLPPPDYPAAPPKSKLRIVPVSELLAPPLPPPAPTQPGKSKRRLSFRGLAKLEPRLRDLLTEARSHHKNRDAIFCANAVWYGYPGFRPGLKSRLSRLVGWRAEQGGDLRTSAAYDLAYQTIYQALPDCRGRCPCSVILGI